MAEQGRQQRELVYCHACHDEWLRDQHGLQCPECHSDVVEIVNLPTLELVYLTVGPCRFLFHPFQTLILSINRLMCVMILETITSMSVMKTTMTRLPQPTTAYPTNLRIITIPGRQRCLILSSPISSMLNGILLRAYISLALPIDHLLLWLEVRPTMPLRPCSKAYLPYLKAQQTQMQIPRVDRKRGLSGPSSTQVTPTVQNLYLRTHSLTTSIIIFTIIILHGFPVLGPQAVDRRSLQRAESGPRAVPMHLRMTEQSIISTG